MSTTNGNGKPKRGRQGEGGGRKSKWGKVDPKKVARVIGRLGGTKAELAEALGYKKSGFAEHAPKLAATLKVAKDAADGNVEKSLFKRAMGYSHESVKIMVVNGKVKKVPFTEHYPPSDVACIFWLKNRRPDEWRDVSRQELSGLDGKPLEVSVNLKEQEMPG